MPKASPSYSALSARTGSGKVKTRKRIAVSVNAKPAVRALASDADQAARDDIGESAQQAQARLSEFIRQAWPVLEPNTPYVHGWHIDAICAHLEAVTHGQIRNLLINMPPRHAKSLIVSVFWPVWEWITTPERRWLFSAYAQKLSARDSLRCRRLITSAWYQNRYGARYQLTRDQNAKIRFENDKTGYRIATSVGGVVTGEGGDRIVVDDPHNVTEAKSAVVREDTLLWWDEAMSTRVNDPKTSAKVIVMQRLHERDLSAHVLQQKLYEHLCLPAEYEGKKFFTTIGWSDPRAQVGELLWPARFGAREIAEMKLQLRAFGTACQLQQRPAPQAGGLIKLEWWRYYREPPSFARVVQSWDTAFKKNRDNDRSVCTTWGVARDGYYLLDCWAGRVEFPELKRVVVQQAAKWRPQQILIEDKASGQSLTQELQRETCLPIKPVGVDPDKIARVNAVTGLIEAGKVFLPQAADWVADFVDECALFPHGRHDDRVDSMTQALAHLARATTPALQRVQINHMLR